MTFSWAVFWPLLICVVVLVVILSRFSAAIYYTLRAIQDTLRGIKDNLDRFENQRREALFPWPEEPPDNLEEWLELRNKVLRKAGF